MNTFDQADGSEQKEHAAISERGCKSSRGRGNTDRIMGDPFGSPTQSIHGLPTKNKCGEPASYPTKPCDEGKVNR